MCGFGYAFFVVGADIQKLFMIGFVKNNLFNKRRVKLMKKVLSIILSLAMLLSITAGIDFSALAKISGDYEYSVRNDGTAEITKYKGSDSNVTIPSTLDGKTVTSIGY